MSGAFNKLCHAERTSTCPSEMSCRCCPSIDGTFVQQSSSYQSPVPNRQHRCRCQAATTVREAFSPQFPFSQRVRSMNSVSFAMLRAEKAGVFQTPQTLREEDSLVADAAVLRLPEILSLLGITLFRFDQE